MGIVSTITQGVTMAINWEFNYGLTRTAMFVYYGIKSFDAHVILHQHRVRIQYLHQRLLAVTWFIPICPTWFHTNMSHMIHTNMSHIIHPNLSYTIHTNLSHMIYTNLSHILWQTSNILSCLAAAKYCFNCSVLVQGSLLPRASQYWCTQRLMRNICYIPAAMPLLCFLCFCALRWWNRQPFERKKRTYIANVPPPLHLSILSLFTFIPPSPVPPPLSRSHYPSNQK